MNSSNRRVALVLIPLIGATANIALAQCGSWRRVTKPPLAQAPVSSSLVVNAPALAARLKEDNTVVIQTGQNREAYEKGHIPGARFIAPHAFVVERGGLETELPSVDALQENLESLGISDDTPIVIAGDPLWAARLFFTLDYMGHGNHAAILDGGVEGWAEAGFPISTTTPIVSKGHLTVRPNPAVVAHTEDIVAQRENGTIQLLDARTEEEFDGRRSGRGITRAGHIPGAVLLNWTEVLTDTGHFKDRDSLAHIFEAAGVQEDRELVSYCRVGHRASMLYFIARWLGRPVRLYDGSYQAWSQGSTHPIATEKPSRVPDGR